MSIDLHDTVYKKDVDNFHKRPIMTCDISPSTGNFFDLLDVAKHI